MNVVVALIGEDKLSGPANAAARAITGIEKAAQSASASAGRSESVFAGVLRGGLALQAIQGVLGGLKTGLDALGEAAIGGNARLEQLRIGFTTLLKSGQDAEAFLFQLQQFAAATPFTFEDVSVGARNLLAMGFAAKDVIPLLTDLGNVVAALGGTSNDVQRLARVLGQMQTTGRVLQGDLLQLASAGVNLGRVYEIMAAQTGKTTAELHKMQEQGQLSTDVFIRAFRTMAQTDAPKGMADQAKSFTGAMSTITDSLQFAAQFAFKPFFDRVSQLAQTIAEFVQKPAFMEWAAQIAAAVDVALEGLGTLADGFMQGLGAVLDITISLGQAIYEALSWLNPFASHSPSLVYSVESGVDAMVAAYGELGRAVPPINATKEGVASLRDEMDRAKEEAKAYGDAVKSAEQALQDLGRQALAGEGAMSDAAFALDQQIAAVQLRMNRMTLSGAPKSAIDAVGKSLEQLRLRADNVRLEDKLKFDPQHRAIEQMINPRDEKSFSQVTSEIQKNQTALKDLRPAAQQAQERYDALAKVVDASEKGMRAIEGAAGGAAGAIGGVGGAVGTAKGALDGFKETIQASREQLDAFKAKYEEAKATITAELTTGKTAEVLAGLKAGFLGAAEGAAVLAKILKDGGIPSLIKAIGDQAALSFPLTAKAIDEGMPAWDRLLERLGLAHAANQRLVLQGPAVVAAVDLVTSQVIASWDRWAERQNTNIDNLEAGWALMSSAFEKTMNGMDGVLDRWTKGAAKAVDQWIRDFKAGWTGFGAAVSAILRGELSGIKIDMGPFHLDATGFRVDPPKFPTFQLPPPFQGPPGLGGGGDTGGAGQGSGGPGALPQFQHGGMFRVGGAGGPDSQLVSFHATPGEVVAVGHARGAAGGGGGGGAPTINVHLGGVTVTNQADEERLVARLVGEIEAAFTDGLRGARGAGVRFPLGVSAPASG